MTSAIRATTHDRLDAGYIGRIPVRNIWLLMLYASELYRVLPEIRRVEVENDPDELPELVAEILTRAVERRLRRNLSHGFRQREADLSRVRGRIDLLRTERHQLLQRGLIACRYDELTVDTPQNRYVRAALYRIAKTVRASELAHRCRAEATYLERAGVGGGSFTSNVDRELRGTVHQLGYMDAEDRQMMVAAHLAFNLALPTEESGRARLPMPSREEQWARRLFERAVGGFYDVTLSPHGWKVFRGLILQWPYRIGTNGIGTILPSMKTDIVLEHSTGRIVIDTKFAPALKQGWYREQTLSSGYIYQMYAYLRSQENRDDPLSRNSTGIVLHPTVEEELDEAAMIQGHELRFTTVNLAADSSAIRERLTAIVKANRLTVT